MHASLLCGPRDVPSTVVRVVGVLVVSSSFVCCAASRTDSGAPISSQQQARLIGWHTGGSLGASGCLGASCSCHLLREWWRLCLCPREQNLPRYHCPSEVVGVANATQGGNSPGTAEHVAAQQLSSRHRVSKCSVRINTLCTHTTIHTDFVHGWTRALKKPRPEPFFVSGTQAFSPHIASTIFESLINNRINAATL